MCLAQGHKAVTPVRLKPAAPRSRVKHSTTEPLRYLIRFLKERFVSKHWISTKRSLCLYGLKHKDSTKTHTMVVTLYSDHRINAILPVRKRKGLNVI